MANFTPADTLSQSAFVVLCLLIVGTFLIALRKVTAQRHSRFAWISAATGAWLVCVTLVPATGLLQAGSWKRLALFFAACNAVSLVVAISPVTRWLAEGTRIEALVAFQGFRLTLEIVLHSWAKQGTIPATMTWSGSNWDVATGVLALLVFPLCGRYRFLALVVNALGIVMLANVARVAIMSSTAPFAWHVSPPLQPVTLPYAWIVPICVGAAIVGHGALTRALLFGTIEGSSRGYWWPHKPSDRRPDQPEAPLS